VVEASPMEEVGGEKTRELPPVDDNDADDPIALTPADDPGARDDMRCKCCGY